MPCEENHIFDFNTPTSNFSTSFYHTSLNENCNIILQSSSVSMTWFLVLDGHVKDTNKDRQLGSSAKYAVNTTLSKIYNYESSCRKGISPSLDVSSSTCNWSFITWIELSHNSHRWLEMVTDYNTIVIG